MDYEQMRRCFKERFKELKKELKKEGYTIANLADKLDVSENTINKWATDKDYGILPSWDTMAKLSQLFDADITYLLGYQACRHIKTQQICDLSGLNEAAGNVIESVKNNERDRYAMEKLLTHDSFPRLLDAIYQYAYCHNVKIEITDKTSSSDNYFPFTDEKKKTAFKLNATETLSDILESLYEGNRENMEYIQGKADLTNMFKTIHWYASLSQHNNNLKEKILDYIRLTLKTLPGHPVYDIFKQIEPEYILKNYKELLKLLKINLDDITPPTT